MVALALALTIGIEPPSLRELAGTDFDIGANFAYLVNGPGPNNWERSPILSHEKRITRRHFSIVSAGWEMYPGRSWLGPDRYDWGGTERFLAWCRENGLHVHGHGLAYNIRVPWLMKMPADTDAERAILRGVHERYVTDTVSRFRGKVAMWDVANEQLQPAYMFRGFLTDAPYWRAYQASPTDRRSGIEWYRATFRLARAADPKAQLVLLEFNNEVASPKADTLLELVSQLRREQVPIDGVGFQMHLDTNLNRGKGHGYKTDEDYYRAFEANLSRFAALGVDLWITELDVAIDPAKPRDSELTRQAEIYGRIVSIARQAPRMRGIKFWGILDRDVWSQPIKTAPNLFDEEGQPKPAFHAVAQALRSYRRAGPTP